MTIQLTTEQWAAMQEGQESPVRVSDPSQTVGFVLIQAAVYERFRALFEDVPVTAEEQQFQLQEFGKRAGWDDPQMDIYNDLDPRRPS